MVVLAELKLKTMAGVGGHSKSQRVDEHTQHSLCVSDITLPDTTPALYSTVVVMIITPHLCSSSYDVLEQIVSWDKIKQFHETNYVSYYSLQNENTVVEEQSPKL